MCTYQFAYFQLFTVYVFLLAVILNVPIFIFFELCTVLMFIMAEILMAPLFKRPAFLFEKIAASDTVLAFWVLSVQSKIDK